eukprot:3336885-Rhodomonas_salina.1
MSKSVGLALSGQPGMACLHQIARPMAQMKAGNAGFPTSHQTRRLVQWERRSIKSLQPRVH